MQQLHYHASKDRLEKGWSDILSSPKDQGTLEMIVIRPVPEERKILEEGTLDLTDGLVGDCWKIKTSSSRSDGGPNPDKQVTVMNTRAIQLIAGDRNRWPLAGDQLYVDLDLSEKNLQPGDQVRIGEAILEVSEAPHTGCKKFVQRYGLEAMKFVNSPEGRKYNLRGINARVIRGGAIKTGDLVVKISSKT